ncbi:MAG TPA: acyltransferase domain-containing protein, partial [Anaeromyxobacter sp.]
AGALSLEDAAKVIALRARALPRLSGRGAMIAVELPAVEVEQRLERFAGRLSIAAVNSPGSTVVSGDADAADALLAELTAAQHFARKVRVDYASHCAHIEALAEALQAPLAGIAPRAAQVPLYSTVTGAKVEGSELDPSYWYRNLRQTVRFEEASRALLADGHRFFVEVSPHPVLNLALQQTIEGSSAPAAVVGSLRRDEGDLGRLLLSACELHARGFRLDWGRVLPRARKVSLPTYAFQRERYWLEAPASRAADVASAGLSSADHPLLGAAVSLADTDGFLFTGRLSLADHPWLAGHAVFGNVILPGTAFVELALVAAPRVGLERIEELTLEAPLALPAKGAVVVQLSVGAPDEAGHRPLTVHARAEDAASWTRHATGLLGPAAPAEAFELRTWPPEGATPLAIDGLYDRAAALGFGYGPEFRGLTAAWQRGDELFAEARLPEGVAPADFGLHPALLDAALHASLLRAGEVALPFSWTGVSLRAVGASSIRVRFARAEGDAFSLQIADAAGEPVASVEALVARPVTAEQLRGVLAVHHDALFRVDWAALPTATPSSPPAAHRALVGADDLALAAALEASSARLDRHRDLAALQEALAKGEAVPETVLVSFSPAPAVDAPAIHEATSGALALLQAWLADDRLASTRLVLVTQRAVAARSDEDVLDLVHAPLWGLVRSAQAEHSDRAIVLLDLDGDDASGQALSAALASDEPQLALRRGELLAPRLARRLPTETLAPPDAAAWRLHFPAQGTLDQLMLVAHPEAAAPLGDGQVRIAVRAAGLNFRDTLIALGMYPGNPGFVGSEGAGVVLEVGPGVSRLAVGDRVTGLFPGAFGPVAISDQRAVTRFPESWSFAEAASVPVVFLTAYYALVDLARLQRGEKVLVHAAAGGVGTAAVQIARHLGAEVFATASPGKWSALRALGFDEGHVASSRTLDFEQQFLRSTGACGGMDVVLDCLAREFVDASLR